MPAEPKEPRTAAGKALAGERLDTENGIVSLVDPRRILAIEDQAATEARRELLAKVPAGTRLVLMSEELALGLGAGRVEWGEPDEHGWYTPTLYRNQRRV